METILGIHLSDDEKDVIKVCMQYALQKDKEEFFLTEERRRILSNLIYDFSNLDQTNKNMKNTVKEIIKKNLQIENSKFILIL